MKTTTGESFALRVIDGYDAGVGWIAYPEEPMQRASHAVAVHNEESETDDVWVIDPVDGDGVDDLLAELGAVAGVVCTFGRHRRDSAVLATRHDVPVFVPEWMTGVASNLDAPIERFGSRLADTGFQSIRIRNSSIPPWQEIGLFDGETLIVPEALGTATLFRGSGERIGVHPLLRFTPPRAALSGLAPKRVLVGHGAGVLEDAAAAVEDALDGSRRRAPSVCVNALRSIVGV